MGEVFAGRYELVDPLGHGGMGAVWRSWDHKIGGYVAAKVLRQVDAMSLLRFVREQAFRIDHPHVVTPLSWAAEDDRVLFTMPLVAGGSLATLRNDFGTLPHPWVAILLDQLLDALGAVHHARIVHRDLKPANLLLEPTGRARPHVRLSDFGISVAIGEPRLTGTSHIVGTPGYLSPEQLRGGAPDPRQDLFAAGVVAVELLVGKQREEGGVRAVGPPPPNVPPPLWAYLARLTAEDPGQRPPTAEIARGELAATEWLPPPTWQPPPDDVAGIEVFHQLPEYPPGWDASGPVRTDSGGPARPEPVHVQTGQGGPVPTPTRAAAADATRVAERGRTLVAPAETPGEPASTPAKPGVKRKVLAVAAILAVLAGAGMMTASALLLLR